MTNTPDLKSAYALGSKDDVKALYETWADSYDADFVEAQGYQMHRHVAGAFVKAKGDGPILDVGAGTGTVGQALAATGATDIDGIDLSADMLRVAKTKGCYRSLITGDITQSLGSIGPYTTIVSAGTFTFGHVGPEGLPALLKVAAPGCLFILGVNAQHFEGAGFRTAFNEFGPRICDLSQQEVRIYDDRADADHRMDMARLMVFRLR